MSFNQIQVCLLFLLLIIASLFCQSPKNDVDNSKYEVVDTMSYDEIEKDLKEEQQAEVYKIEKKAVIFFMIDRNEAKKLAREIGDSYRWETDALINGFIDQSREFGKLVRKHNIKSDLVHSKRFQIILKNGNSIYFDRIKEDQIMGEIITDGEKEPLIKYGMSQNRELASFIQDFFNIENLGYIPPDTLHIPIDESEDMDTVVILKPEN